LILWLRTLRLRLLLLGRWLLPLLYLGFCRRRILLLFLLTLGCPNDQWDHQEKQKGELFPQGMLTFLA
jgi:hypothetical protein